MHTHAWDGGEAHRGDSGRGRTRRLRAAAPLALAAGLIALALLPSNAPALLVRKGEETLGYQPLPRAASRHAARHVKPLSSRPLEYHSGPVMPSNTNYALYWDPAGAGEYPAGYETGIDKYFEDLAHDSGGLTNTDSVLTQYGDKEGHFANYNSHFGGALLDTDPYPANGCASAPVCLTDEQLRGEIAKYVEVHKLPANLEHEFFLLTPPGVESCLEAAGHECSAGASHATYCSYHGYITALSGVIVYANTPYLAATNCDTGEEHPNGNPSDATIGGGLAHEHAESVTDPELNAWRDAKGEEIGDKCRTLKAATEFGEPLGKAPDGANYNQLIDGDLYLYQQEWSNETGACEQREAQLPTVAKLSPRSGSAAGGTEVTITGNGFANPATVHFGAIAAAKVTVNSANSITATAPAQSAGSVDVTVTTAVGTSAVTKKDHFKYKKAK